jgi:intergrase/recombinase
VARDRILDIGGQALRKAFDSASQQSGIRIKPKDLRDWFACEMGRLGVQDRYVDAFQGRVPKTILARHYSDFTPEKPKAIYDSAVLRVTNGSIVRELQTRRNITELI